ncbi:MAG: molybdopterin-containing oxidoreductase family protein, partial [Ilumatobacteraceae bacterium]
MGKQITACSLDCPDSCSLEVTVEDGKLIALDGITDGPNPSTKGWICAKVKNTPQLLHGPDRITTPLRRSGPKGSGQFVEIGWDEALDLFAQKVTEAVATHGWESVVPYLYSSSAGKLGRAGLSPLVWEHLGAARTDITICAATVGEAWDRTYGSLPSADPQDLRHSELIVVWGANPNVSHPHLGPVIEERRRAGAKLVVVDPRRTPIADRADLHLAVRPGTDGVLAMAVAALLQRDCHLDMAFIDRWVDGADHYLAACEQWTPARAAEICGLTAADIERFAEMYGTIRPAMLRVGWGQERNRNGGSASRAVFALPALAGQFGVPGSGVFNSISGGGVGYDTAAIRREAVGDAAPPDRRPINMNRLGRILVDDEGGRVDVLFVQGSNPAATCPEQAIVLHGLARDDLFTVVHDLTMTDTARLADLVLPATSLYEVDEIVGSYGSFVVQDAPAAIPRVGESRTNDEVSVGVGIRLGLDPQQWDPNPQRLRRLALGDRLLPFTKLPTGAVQFRDVLPAGKVQLVCNADGVDSLPVYRPLEAPDLPITLITPATSRTTSSMFGNIAPASADVHLHPGDAAARGLNTGDRARITNGRHTIEATVAIDATLRPGLATM